MAAHIVYQPFRFGIAKATGCLTSLSNTWPTWVCYFIWAPLFSFVGCLLTCKRTEALCVLVDGADQGSEASLRRLQIDNPST